MSDAPNLIPVQAEDRIAAQQKAVEILDTNPGQRNVGGRGNTNIDENCVQLLIAAFQKGLDVRSACVYAGISKSAYYERCKNDKSFLDTMERAKNNLIVAAGIAVDEIVRDPGNRDRGKMARWILEKKLPDEYGQKIVNNDNRTQNFLVLNNEQLTTLGQRPDVKESDPTELFKALEDASNVVDGAEA